VLAVLLTEVFRHSVASEADEKNKLQLILNKNEQLFLEISKTFDLTVKNSDVILRFSHYTDGHKTKTNFCPECFNTSLYSDDKLKHEPNIEPVKVDLDQLLKDSNEFCESIKVLNASLVNQNFALSHTLSQLKKEKHAGN
jgi:hypothetical protein